ncbi:MAG: ABC transporter ATP-binding protein [Deferrisomatales bacterium]
MSQPMLQLEDVSLHFGGLQVLNRVSLEVPAGKITSIVGPNGAGKTSLFNVIGGFYTPSAGRVLFEGRDITKLRPAQRAHLGIGRTFQNIALYKGLSVLDNIKLGAHVRTRAGMFAAGLRLPSARREEMAVRQRVETEVIDFLEIEHIRSLPVQTLAYGLRKRVELARALALEPRLLLLDEPVAGMNREETEDMARFVLDVVAERGATVLLVEHDMGMVMDLSDHVVVLNFGEVIAAGRPDEVSNHPEVIRAYLGTQGAGEEQQWTS